MTLYRHVLSFALMIALVAGFAGCSKEQPESAAVSTPDEAVVRIAKGLADGKPETAWTALPPSYRADVTDLVHRAAGKMDADVWNQSFALLQKLTRLARDKREFILDHPMMAQNLSERSEAEAGWDAVVGLFDVLVDSDLADLKKLEQLDVERFLKSTGGELMQQLEAASALTPDDDWSKQMNDLRRAKAEIVSRSGDSAVVRIETPDKPATEDTYVRVEGHWVPKELADEWPAKIAEARQKIDEVSDEYMAENKQALLMQLSMVEGALDSLLEAKTAEQFHAQLGPIMGMAMGAMMTQAMSQPSVMTPAPSVTPEFGNVELSPETAEIRAQPIHEQTPSPVATMPETRETREIARSAVPDLHTPKEISFSEARGYVGRNLRVVTGDGVDAICKLKEARPDALVLERKMYGGTISMEVTSDEIELIQVIER